MTIMTSGVYPNKHCPHPTQVGFWGLWGPGSLATWLAPSSGGCKRHRCCLHPGGPFTFLIFFIFLLYSTLYTFLHPGGPPFPFIILYSILLFLIPPSMHLSFQTKAALPGENDPDLETSQATSAIRLFLYKVL